MEEQSCICITIINQNKLWIQRHRHEHPAHQLMHQKIVNIYRLLFFPLVKKQFGHLKLNFSWILHSVFILFQSSII